MAKELHDSTVDDDFDDGRDRTKWVILVDMKTGAWIIQPVTPGSEVGEYDPDLSKGEYEYRVASLFDRDVEKLLTALTQIGGDSLEVNQNIEGLLMGTCRSFVEAQENLKKWQKEQQSS